MIFTLFDERSAGEREELVKKSLDSGVILSVISILPGEARGKIN
jgi:hypothetical protein